MKPTFTRMAWLSAAAGSLVLWTACDIADELLQVDNPEEIQLEALDDPALLEVQVNGVIGNFNSLMDDPYIRYSNFLTDEILSGLNWEDYARASQRIASYLEGPTAPIFEAASRSLRQAHDVADRIRGWATDDPDTDFRADLATVLTYAGYSAVMLAEGMCQAVISPDADDPSGEVLEQPAVFAAALPYLEEGLSVASAVGATEIANLARVGLARAHLGRAEWSDVVTYATAVDPGFARWMEFVDQAGGRNALQGTSTGGNFTHGIHPWFTGVHPSFDATGFVFTDDDVIAPQTDPRIQHAVTDITGHNALTRLYKLFQGLRYSDYTGETIAPTSAGCPDCTGTAPGDMELIAGFGTDVLMADYLEAQHHRYEAMAMMGGNDAAVLTFVNARRAVGNQPSVTLSGDDLIRELRNQRGRDLFMGGFRLGDLRRWTRYDAGNGPFAGGSYFPTGTHPNTQWGPYGDWTCFPIPLSEYEGNDNLQRPNDPTVPPAI